MNLSLDEARLIAIYRALEESGDDLFVKTSAAGILLEYLDAIIDFEALEAKSDKEIESYLNGVVTGYFISRLEFADVPPERVQRIEEGQAADTVSQTGVDPTTGKVRT